MGSTLVERLVAPNPAITEPVERARVRHLLSLQLLLVVVGVPIVLVLRWVYPRLGDSFLVGIGGLGSILLCYGVTRSQRWRTGGILSSLVAIGTGLVLAGINPKDGTWPITAVIATLLAAATLNVMWAAIIGVVGMASTLAMVMLHPGFDTLELVLPPLTIQAASIPLVILTGWQQRRLEALRLRDLSAHRERLSQAQILAKMGSWSIDTKSGECFVSEQARQYVQPEELERNPIDALIEPIDDEFQLRLRRSLQEVLSGNSAGIYAERLPLKAGDGRIANLIVRNREEAGLVEGTIQDVTETVKAEEERRSLQRALDDARRLETVGRMASGVAHDFNNLLTVILTANQLLERSYPDDRFVREIFGAGERGQKLVKQLLAFAGKQRLRPEPLQPGAVIADLAPILHRLIDKDVQLECEGLDSEHWVLFDPVQLEQIVVNLVVNARDAMPDGGEITVRLQAKEEAPPPPNAKVWPDGVDVLCLSVRDTGTGMSQDTIERVFEPFFTTKEEGKGTGLGLATVDGIVRQSGGCLDVKSVVGQGTEFRIFLPLTDRTRPREVVPATTSPRTAESPLPSTQPSATI